MDAWYNIVTIILRRHIEHAFELSEEAPLGLYCRDDAFHADRARRRFRLPERHEPTANHLPAAIHLLLNNPAELL